jgi:hypothetical protein
MSLIKANDLQNASGGIPTVKGQRLIPTAWVNFNGTGTVSIRDSENVSSITDVGNAKYGVNFATAMANTNYCAVTNGSRLNDYVIGTNPGQRSTSLIYIYSGGFNASSSISTDSDEIQVVIMGGQ